MQISSKLGLAIHNAKDSIKGNKHRTLSVVVNAATGGVGSFDLQLLDMWR